MLRLDARMGRQSKFTPAIAAEICERLATGEPLAVICRDDHMPATRTVSDWRKEHEGFAADYARARLEGFDALAAQCLEISDNETHDWLMTKKGVIVNEVAIGRAKLQVWTRLQLLAKWYPSKYGDKQSLELTGADGGPVQITDTERAARLAAIVATARARAQGQQEGPSGGDDMDGLV
ncbi:terminase [Bordetella hinzii]|uniref:terminase small subunit-like protein n=1 Tax=Bordetella hinzii TaxID=103855 RepID=UPI0013EFF5D6|nr:terminase [Bordetella hinzii]QII84248.1 terminase [Bordetella hinzii]